MGSGAPNLINPYSAATTQQDMNVLAGEQSQRGSMVGQVGPTSSTQFQQTGTGPGGVPTYTETQTLTPTALAMLTGSQGVGIAGSAAANKELQNFDANGNPVPFIGNMTSGTLGELEDSYLASVLPSQQTQLAQTETTLENQGITPGSPAWTNTIRPIIQGQQQANLGAAAQFEPAAFGQAVTEQSLPLTEAIQAAGLNTYSPSPNIAAPGLNIAPANYLGATSAYNNAQIQEQQAQNQFWQSLGNMGANLFEFGAAPQSSGGLGLLAAMSDRRLKRDITEIDQLGEIPVYLYRFNGRWWAGFMSDDVSRVYPDCVGTKGDYETVNYSRVVAHLALDLSMRELMEQRGKLDQFVRGPIALTENEGNRRHRQWLLDCTSTELLRGLEV